MKWTEPMPPTKDVSCYDFTDCETPLGKCRIEWKSWKQQPSFDIQLGDDYIDTAYSLEDAKQMAEAHIYKKYLEIGNFLIF